MLGGYGYTREYPVEQYYRDNRLNPIHEGSNGIQAIDLLGRKAMMERGAALQAMLGELRATAAEAAELPMLGEYSSALLDAVARIEATTQALGARMAGGEVRLALANASLYLTLVGHAFIAWIWLKQALLASRALAGASAADLDFYQGKLAACRYFFRYELPIVQANADLLQAMDDTTLAMQPEHF